MIFRMVTPLGGRRSAMVPELLRPITRTRFALPLALLTGIPLLAFLVTPGLWATLSLLLVVGVSTAYMLPVQRAFAAAVPPGARGHAFGLAATGLMTSQGLGAFCVGVLASVLAPASAIAMAGGIGSVSVLLLRRSLSSRLLAPDEDRI